MEQMTVKQWRMVKGFSQREFADKVGIKIATYQTKESGKRPWLAREVKRISEVLEIDLDKIIVE